MLNVRPDFVCIDLPDIVCMIYDKFFIRKVRCVFVCIYLPDIVVLIKKKFYPEGEACFVCVDLPYIECHDIR